MPIDWKHWESSKEGMALSRDQVGVWLVPLDRMSSFETKLKEELSPDEISRAERFKVAKPRRDFVITRAVLRRLLARFTGYRPEDIQFRYQEFGRPELVPSQNHNQLSFNLAHSGDLAVIALSVLRTVGVDIEMIRSDVECEELARRYFSSRERRQILSLTSEDQKRAFFACWTRKEAFLKATGIGLSYPLSQFSVTIDPDLSPVLEAVCTDPDAVRRWHFANLHPADGYLGTLVYDQDECEVKTWECTAGLNI